MLVLNKSTSKLLTLERQKYSSITDVFFNCSLLLSIVLSIVFPLSGVVIILTAGLTNLKCDRVEPTLVNCELTSSSSLGNTTTSIKQLKGTEVKVREDSEGGTYEEVFLVTKYNDISVTV